MILFIILFCARFFSYCSSSTGRTPPICHVWHTGISSFRDSYDRRNKSERHYSRCVGIGTKTLHPPPGDAGTTAHQFDGGTIDWYQVNFCGKELIDPRGYRVHFLDTDFVHLIKMVDKYGKEAVQ